MLTFKTLVVAARGAKNANLTQGHAGRFDGHCASLTIEASSACTRSSGSRMSSTEIVT